MIIKLDKLTPSVYTEESRDFQLLCRIFDTLYNGIQGDVLNITKILDTSAINSDLLYLLLTKLGFFSDILFSQDELRYILDAFPYMTKYKGSYRAVCEMVNLCLKVYKTNTEYLIEVVNRDTVVNGITLKAPSVIIGIKTSLKNTDLFKVLSRYVIPPGYLMYIYFYTTVSISDTQDYQDSVELLYSSSNIESRVRTATALYKNASNQWVQLGRYYGVSDSSLTPYATTVITAVSQFPYFTALSTYSTSANQEGSVLQVYYEPLTQVKYFLLAKTADVVSDGSVIPSSVLNYSWVELQNYLKRSFSENDFFYSNKFPQTGAKGYYRFVKNTITSNSSLTIAGTSVQFSLNNLTFSNAVGNIPGFYSVVATNSNGVETVYINGDKTTLSFSDLGITISGLYSQSDSKYFLCLLKQDGQWSNISNNNIKFTSGSIFVVNSHNEIINQVSNTPVASQVKLSQSLEGYTLSGLYLGTFATLTQLQSKYLTPTEKSMAIVGGDEYYYKSSSWHKIRYRGVFDASYKSSWPASLGALQDYDLVGISSKNNRVYFRYDGTKWIAMRNRGSVPETIITNYQENDFVNPSSGSKYYTGTLWSILGNYLGVSAEFPQNASLGDYVYISGATYYIYLNNLWVDETETAYVMESKKFTV